MLEYITNKGQMLTKKKAMDPSGGNKVKVEVVLKSPNQETFVDLLVTFFWLTMIYYTNNPCH